MELPRLYARSPTKWGNKRSTTTNAAGKIIPLGGTQLKQDGCGSKKASNDTTAAKQGLTQTVARLLVYGIRLRLASSAAAATGC